MLLHNAIDEIISPIAKLVPGATLIEYHTRTWQSRSFAGARHEIRLSLTSQEQADKLAAVIVHVCLALPGHLLADAKLLNARVDDFRFELLTVED